MSTNPQEYKLNALSQLRWNTAVPLTMELYNDRFDEEVTDIMYQV